jgi:hypothetical protein
VKDRIQLDWSRLLGFDQLSEGQRLESSGLAKSGSKQRAANGALSSSVGSKPLAIEAKVSVKAASPALGHRVSAKIGSKPGIKQA